MIRTFTALHYMVLLLVGYIWITFRCFKCVADQFENMKAQNPRSEEHLVFAVYYSWFNQAENLVWLGYKQRFCVIYGSNQPHVWNNIGVARGTICSSNKLHTSPLTLCLNIKAKTKSSCSHKACMLCWAVESKRLDRKRKCWYELCLVLDKMSLNFPNLQPSMNELIYVWSIIPVCIVELSK